MIRIESKFKLWIAVCLLLSLVVIPQHVFPDETQIYQETDRVFENKKYLERLTEDNRKVDLAIKTTKRLIHQSRTKPYLPELYLRLSELYIEKSRIVYFLKKQTHPGAVKSLDKVEANLLKNQALELYQRILNNFPNFADRDKVLFFMAHEYRELGQHEAMAAQYHKLIDTCPKSKYVPECYLLLGDYAIAHQNLEVAQSHYRAVLGYPHSSAVAIARYKLGWCYINGNNFKAALSLFEACVTSLEPRQKLEIDTYKRVNVKYEALMDLAYCYTEVYQDQPPEAALAYFQKHAWSRPVYVAVLEKLANRYFIKKKWQQAAVVYRQLATLSNDAKNLLAYTRNIFECAHILNQFTYAEKDVAFIIKALKKQAYSIHFDPAEKKKSLENYEKYARNIITQLHEKARREKSPQAFQQAAGAYTLYLDFFRESPVRRQMNANYAEALFSAQQFIPAGKQYEQMLAEYEDETSPLKKDQKYQDTLFSAIISYYNALKDKEPLNYYETVYARTGLRTRGEQYVAEFPQAQNVAEVLFNVAWVTYDEGKYEQAISAFSRFIERYPNRKTTAAAVHLVLDTYYLKEDYKGLAAYGKKVLGDTRIQDKSLKLEVQKIVAAAESKVISTLTLAIADDYQKGSQKVRDFIEQNNVAGLNEQALQVLLATSKEKADFATLISAGEKLVSNYPHSEKVGDTIKLLADTSLNAAQFRLVAKYLEMYARRFGNQETAAKFMLQAAQIRQQLAQYNQSNQDFAELVSKPQASSKIEAIVFAMVNNALATHQHDLALKLLIANFKRFSKLGRIKARAQLSDLYYQRHNPAQAARYHKAAHKKYRPRSASRHPELRKLMARMDYDFTNDLHNRYLQLQLKDRLDNSVVEAKTRLHQDLEKRYQQIMGYQDPQWALTACYQSYGINIEFARFLKEAPLPPGLTKEQKQQYETIITQKAHAYSQNADQYLQICLKQAHKWEICDPEAVTYYAENHAAAGPFSGKESQPVEGQTILHDETLKSLHAKLMAHPNDVESLMMLTNVYLEKGDYRQAMLVANKILTDTDIKMKPLKSHVYNLKGVCCLYAGKDEAAKEAFKQALGLDSLNLGARINLAGLYRYYQHADKALKLYQALPQTGIIEKSSATIHPHAMELYDAFKREDQKAN